MWLQLSHFIVKDGDYALNKDVDVAPWLDYRASQHMNPLKDAGTKCITRKLEISVVV